MPPKKITNEEIFNKLQDMESNIASKDDIAELQEKMQEKYRKIIILEDKVAILQNVVHTLKQALNTSDQYTRRTNLRIQGVEMERYEKSEDCFNTVLKVINTMKLPIPEMVIDRAHPVEKPKNGKPPAIIVRFTTWRHRTLLYRARKEVKKKDGL